MPAVRGQRHDRHDPGPQAGQREHHELPAVGQLDHDPVTARQAEATAEPGGQRVGPGRQGRVAEPRRAVHHGGHLRPGPRGGREFGAEGRPAPPPGGRVGAGRLRGQGTIPSVIGATMGRLLAGPEDSVQRDQAVAVTRSGLISISSRPGRRPAGRPAGPAPRPGPARSATGPPRATRRAARGRPARRAFRRPQRRSAGPGPTADVRQRLGRHTAQARAATTGPNTGSRRAPTTQVHAGGSHRLDQDTGHAPAASQPGPAPASSSPGVADRPGAPRRRRSCARPRRRAA